MELNLEQSMRDTIAINVYGKPFDSLPDDGIEQDWIATEVGQRLEEYPSCN